MNLKSITTLLLLTSIVLLAQTGYASWYGNKYQGKLTASGEPFNMYDYTAANRTFPLGTIVKVTNLKNNKSVKVRINDRGPTKKSRIIDLSYQAAKDIGLLEDGVATVKVEPLSKSTKINSPKRRDNSYLKGKKSNNHYFHSKLAKNSSSIKIQIGAFSSRENAKSFIESQRDSGYSMKIIEVRKSGKKLYKVVIVCNSSSIASRIIKSKRYSGAFILR